jgi:nucleoside-diphosphate-sugar epimerase
MTPHVIFGAGPVGTAVARILLDRGDQVRVVTRSGSGLPGTERVAADASDAARVRELTRGAAAIYNCVNPPYTSWQQDWPPIAAALLDAARGNGAVLAITGNLYGYGPVNAPMTEQTPLAATGTKGRVRAAMWQDVERASRAGEVRGFEVRGSDYLGNNSLLGMLIAPALRKGRRVYLPVDLDAPHTWTNTDDVARLLVTGADDERAWGRAWHVPSADPVSARELTRLAAEELGVTAKVSSVGYPVLWAMGLFSPMMRELRETQHQFRKPFVLDSSAAQHTFDLKPTALIDSIRDGLAESA